MFFTSREDFAVPIGILSTKFKVESLKKKLSQLVVPIGTRGLLQDRAGITSS